jgi:hypothetical protein
MASVGNSLKYSGGTPASDPAWRVVLALGPSRTAGAWITGLAGLTLAVAVWLPAPGWASAALVAAILAGAVRSARRHAGQEGPGAVRRLVIDLSGHVEVTRADGSIHRGRVVDGSFVAPWLTIVRWRPEGSRFSRAVVIAPDAAPPQDFRRLRVLLRWR